MGAPFLQKPKVVKAGFAPGSAFRSSAGGWEFKRLMSPTEKLRWRKGSENGRQGEDVSGMRRLTLGLEIRVLGTVPVAPSLRGARKGRGDTGWQPKAVVATCQPHHHPV